MDGGTYWENVSDGFLQTAAVGAIDLSMDPSNPRLLCQPLTRGGAGGGKREVAEKTAHETEAGSIRRDMGKVTRRSWVRVRAKGGRRAQLDAELAYAYSTALCP
jgi:hypothetical protein